MKFYLAVTDGGEKGNNPYYANFFWSGTITTELHPETARYWIEKTDWEKLKGTEKLEILDEILVTIIPNDYAANNGAGITYWLIRLVY